MRYRVLGKTGLAVSEVGFGAIPIIRLSQDEALPVLRRRPLWVEVVLTGRRAPQALLDLADLVTEMRPLKHYYQAGVRARRGIEW